MCKMVESMEVGDCPGPCHGSKRFVPVLFLMTKLDLPAGKLVPRKVSITYFDTVKGKGTIRLLRVIDFQMIDLGY